MQCALRDTELRRQSTPSRRGSPSAFWMIKRPGLYPQLLGADDSSALKRTVMMATALGRAGAGVPQHTKAHAITGRSGDARKTDGEFGGSR